MFPHFVSRFALPIHLAIVAALPATMLSMASEDSIGKMLLWVSLLGAVWIFMEPALRSGERLRDARLRTRQAILHDPFFWFLCFVVLFAWIRWLNNGIAATYDSEGSVWFIREAFFEWLPASTGSHGFGAFASVVAILVVSMGVLHALGKSGRACFALTASLMAALGGIVSVCFAVFSGGFWYAAACAEFGALHFPGIHYVIFLALAIAGGVSAEEHGWSGARLLFAIAIAGNLMGALFFLPILGFLLFVIPVVIYAVFALFRLYRVKSVACVARAVVMIAFGVIVTGFAFIGSGVEPIIESKRAGMVMKNVFTEERLELSHELNRIAKEMWLKHPWIGNGVGTYGLRLPYLVKEEDWDHLPSKPVSTLNSYSGVFAERGIIGCALFVIGLVFFVAIWGTRGFFEWRKLTHETERMPIVYSISIGVWCGSVTLVPFVLFMYFSAVYLQVTVFCGLVAVLAYAAASFPPQIKSDTKAS